MLLSPSLIAGVSLELSLSLSLLERLEPSQSLFVSELLLLRADLCLVLSCVSRGSTVCTFGKLGMSTSILRSDPAATLIANVPLYSSWFSSGSKSGLSYIAGK